MPSNYKLIAETIIYFLLVFAAMAALGVLAVFIHFLSSLIFEKATISHDVAQSWILLKSWMSSFVGAFRYT